MPESDDRGRGAEGARQRLLERLQRLDRQGGLVGLVRAGRRLLPGDAEYGDPLSLAGSEAPQIVGQRVAALTEKRPSALRELGLGAVQVWQGASEAQGRGHGDRELTILFTDLVGFSDWALDAGDTQTLELLRRVGLAVEPPLKARGGRIVKRLGDGLMVVFDDVAEAVEAAHEAAAAVEDLARTGTPRFRAGLHVGRPRKLGGDYYGVDVNIAARVAAAAGANEVLVSDAAHDRLEAEGMSLRRKWRFKAKGAPKSLKVYAAEVGG